MLGILPCGTVRAANLLGTWDLAMPSYRPLKVQITQQTSGSGLCQRVYGKVVAGDDADKPTDIDGFYCPDTGKIEFVRKYAKTLDTIQFFLGFVAGDGGLMNGILADIRHSRESGFAAARAP